MSSSRWITSPLHEYRAGDMTNHDMTNIYDQGVHCWTGYLDCDGLSHSCMSYWYWFKSGLDICINNICFCSIQRHPGITTDLPQCVRCVWGKYVWSWWCQTCRHSHMNYIRLYADQSPANSMLDCLVWAARLVEFHSSRPNSVPLAGLALCASTSVSPSLTSNTKMTLPFSKHNGWLCEGTEI